MTRQDLHDHSEYLHRLFASVGLMMDDQIYSILGIQDPEIKQLFQSLATTKFQSLKDRAGSDIWKFPMRTPYKLRPKTDIDFHTLWVAKRPIIKGFHHWAIKLEGMLYEETSFIAHSTVH